MKESEFRKWLMKKRRFYKGCLDYYSYRAVESRIVWLEKLEKFFNINLEDKIINESIAKNFLVEIRRANIENLKHTPASNAFRHYFEFATGKRIMKIF